MSFVLSHFRKIKSAFLLFTLLLIPLSALSQNKISVIKFESDDMNTYALNNPTYDNMGNACALIIVHNVDRGQYRFALNCWSKVEYGEIDGEKVYLIWVPDGTNTISISNDDRSIEPLNNYHFKRVRRTKVYNMTLDEIVSLDAKSQYLEFKITPPTATLVVDGLPWKVNDKGEAYQLVKLGSHKYSVKAPGYQEETGEIKMLTPETKRVEVNLYENFGYLTISGGDELKDAEIFLDNAIIGQGALTKYRLVPGDYNLTITKKLYLPYQSDIEIFAGETTVITPKLEANFASVTVNAANPDDEIFIDNEYVGKGSYRGQIKLGSHVVEARQEHHQPVFKEIAVNSVDDNAIVNFSGLQRINGSLSVESTPNHADVYIDNVLVGQTPYYTDNILEGRHNVKVEMLNHDTYETSVNITGGVHSNIDATLPDMVTVTINGVDRWDITSKNSVITNENGKVIARAKGGTEDVISLDKKGYWKTSKKINFDRPKEITINRQKLKVARTEFYIDCTYDLPSVNGVAFGYGLNLWGFNYAYNATIGSHIGLSFVGGWGFRVSPTIKITPQVGWFNSLCESGHRHDKGSIFWGVRAQYALLKWLNVVATPYFDNVRGPGLKVGLSLSIGDTLFN